MERTVSCPFLWWIYGNIWETCINTSLVYQWSQLGINWYLHSSFNGTSTVCGLMKVGFNNFYWDTSVLGGQTAVHSCVWICWEWKVAISNACHWKSPPFNVYLTPCKNKTGSVPGLTGTCSHSYYNWIFEKNKSVQKKPRIPLFINACKSWSADSPQFRFEILQDASEKQQVCVPWD